MSVESISFYALLFGFLWLMSWRRESEFDETGAPVALYRGPKLASPIILGVFAYMMYDAFVVECYGIYAESIIISVILGAAFLGGVLYFVKRKVYISGNVLVGEFPFRKPKKLDLSEEFELKRSQRWGGMMAASGTTRILIEDQLSGSEGLVKELERRNL